MPMNVRLAIRDHEKAAVPQFVPDAHGEPLGSPESIGGLAQLGFFLCCGTGLGEACGKGGHFAGEGME